MFLNKSILTSTGPNSQHAAARLRHASGPHTVPESGRGLRGRSPLQFAGLQLQVARQGPRLCRDLTERSSREEGKRPTPAIKLLPSKRFSWLKN